MTQLLDPKPVLDTSALDPSGRDRQDPPALDPTVADAFAGRMLDILNDGALALMIGIGHQVGLFDTMADLPPSTSAEIADAARLDERYVREWLGALATGGVIAFDATADTYQLPAEHATLLTRSAGPDNLAIQTQYIGLLADVSDEVAACFRSGGGVGYHAFDDFHRLMAEDSGAVLDAALLDTIVPLVPGLVGRLTQGLDVADIGCGSGHAMNLLAAAFPASRFVGFDISAEAIAAARREAVQLGLTNVTFEEADATALDITDAYDLVTAFDAIHDQAHPARVLAAISAALRDDGTFLMVDIKASSRLEDNLDHPLGPFLYSCSTLHCMTVSLAEDGVGLGTMWGEQLARAMLHSAGFGQVDVTEVDGDLLNSYYIARR